ncbi:MAG: UDP-galactopyranose mutase [Oscillospiraceae bacterium]
MQDVIIVGSGFSGSILARKIAEELNQKVLVIEKRPHIAGNMYDEVDDLGILVQKYGPHFLNTNKYFIIEFLQKYSELFKHNTKLLSFIDEKYIRLPFNFETVQQLVGAEKSEKLLNKFRTYFGGRDRVAILELVNHRDKDINEYGNLLFDKAYKTYTAKQWGISVDEIDKYVLERVPMAMNYDERYLNKDFQYLPKHGFTKLFNNMLSHPNIEVKLNTDALNFIKFNEENRTITYDNNPVKCLIFTGAIDELFSLKHGALPYRSLEIKYEYSNEDSILPAEIVSYPQANGYTRRTEYKKITYDNKKIKGSMIATEFPLQYDRYAEKGNTPYYPVLTEKSKQAYGKYLDEAGKYDNIFLCGRLAEFKYYNMDICIEHALEYFNYVKKYLETE